MSEKDVIGNTAEKCFTRTIFGCSLRTACLSEMKGASYAVLLMQVPQRRAAAPKKGLLEASWEHFGDLLGTFWGAGARLEENAL